MLIEGALKEERGLGGGRSALPGGGFRGGNPVEVVNTPSPSGGGTCGLLSVDMSSSDGVSFIEGRGSLKSIFKVPSKYEVFSW